MRTLRVADGALLTYSVSAPRAARGALLLLHGLASNRTRWTEFASTTALREEWALLRPDLRGQGQSVFHGRIGMADWCADLVALLDAESVERAVLVGHCLGANLALAFAARYPQRSGGLVLIEPMASGTLIGAMRNVRRLRPLVRLAVPLVRGLNALGMRRRELPQLDLLQLDRDTRTALADGPEGEAKLAQYASPLADLRTTPTGAYLQALLAVTAKLPPLERIGVPVLVLLSAHSDFTDVALTRSILRTIPDCEIAQLPARHWIPTEQPDAMRTAIEDWVRRRFASAWRSGTPRRSGR